MTKKIKKLYNWHKKLKIIKPQYILILAIIMTLVSGYALRQNNLHMVELKQKVEQADKDNGDIEGALRELREFVYAHMNTNLSSGSSIKPPIQLKYQYERLMAQNTESVKQANIKVNADASAVCASQHPGDGYNQAKVTCIQQYVATNAVKGQEVPSEFYKFDFVSPRWSPDLAGWSLVLAGLLYILFFLRLAVDSVLMKRLEDKF